MEGERVPGREFPQLPQRVASTLQQLWNEALDGAHDALHAALAERENTLAAMESALELQRVQLEQDARAAEGRLPALEESLHSACSQLTEANRRATLLEEALRERDGALDRLRQRVEEFEAEQRLLRQQWDGERTEHLTERARLEARRGATEARWLTEVDRVRQSHKDADKRAREMQMSLDRARRERQRLTGELLTLKAELKTALAVREQLEVRLRTVASTGAKQTRARRARKKTRSTSNARIS
jgi:chromosome segregation ATPase